MIDIIVFLDLTFNLPGSDWKFCFSCYCGGQIFGYWFALIRSLWVLISLRLLTSLSGTTLGYRNFGENAIHIESL